MKMPPIKKDLCAFEKMSKPSEDVLVMVHGWADIWIGRYIHGAEEWNVNGITGQPIVTEWWTMPEKGTGNRES